MYYKKNQEKKKINSQIIKFKNIIKQDKKKYTNVMDFCFLYFEEITSAQS